MDPNLKWRNLHTAEGDIFRVAKVDMLSRPYVLVAKDGTGDYTSIQAAISDAPTGAGGYTTWIMVKPSTVTYDDSGSNVDLQGKNIAIFSETSDVTGDAIFSYTQMPTWSLNANGITNTGGTSLLYLHGITVAVSGGGPLFGSGSMNIQADRCWIAGSIYGTNAGGDFAAWKSKIGTVFTQNISGPTNVIVRDCLGQHLWSTGITVTIQGSSTYYLFENVRFNSAGSVSSTFNLGPVTTGGPLISFNRCRITSGGGGTITFSSPRDADNINVSNCTDFYSLTFSFGSVGRANITLVDNHMASSTITINESVGDQSEPIYITGVYRKIVSQAKVNIDATITQFGVTSDTALNISSNNSVVIAHLIPGTTSTGVTVSGNNNLFIVPNMSAFTTPKNDTGTGNRFITAAVDPIALTSAHILVGNGSNVATDVAMSGDVGIDNAGVTTIKTNVALAGSPTTTTQSPGDSTTKIATTAFVANAVSGAAGAPTGAVFAFATSTAPTGYALCDGSSQLRTDPTYAALFAVIGTTFGAVDGTHFTLPDLRTRFVYGYKSGTNNIADTGGGTTHLHAVGTLANAASNVPGTGLTIPQHSHTLSASVDGTAFGTMTWVSAAAPNIFMKRVTTASWTATVQNSSVLTIAGSSTAETTGLNVQGNTDTVPSVTGVTGNATAAAQVISGSTATQTGPIDPYIVLAYVIKL